MFLVCFFFPERTNIYEFFFSFFFFLFVTEFRQKFNFYITNVIFHLDKSCENRFSNISSSYKCNGYFTSDIFNCCYNKTICRQSDRLRSYSVSGNFLKNIFSQFSRGKKEERENFPLF